MLPRAFGATLTGAGRHIHIAAFIVFLIWDELRHPGREWPD